MCSWMGKTNIKSNILNIFPNQRCDLCFDIFPLKVSDIRFKLSEDSRVWRRISSNRRYQLSPRWVHHSVFLRNPKTASQHSINPLSYPAAHWFCSRWVGSYLQDNNALPSLMLAHRSSFLQLLLHLSLPRFLIFSHSTFLLLWISCAKD